MRKYILLFIYCLMAVTCLGDTDIPYNETDYSQSPNISTLGQFGDIPVSQFTGVPKISIPICKIEINGKSIPITLDYHTSGIRMEQKPGWIGAGWSLMAAGAIVRLQNGGNDEYQHFMKKKNIIYGGQGYFQNLNDLNNDNWGTQSFLNDFIENYNSTYLSLNQDLDPDEFRFDFLGHSGSFFKDCQGQWQIRSKENFRIADMSLGKVPYEAPDNLGKPDVIVGFTLIGDNGGLIIGNQADYSCEYAYDLNGNITSLTRNGVAMSVQAFDFKCWNFGMIDDAKFEYDGNQLIRAYDDCESLTYAAAMDFKARTAKSNQYSWDANGNMTSDMNRNITKITYNFLNLPYEIHFADGHINRYTYTSDGRKLRVEYMISNTGVIDARDYGEFSSSPLPSRVNEVPNSAIEGTFNDTHDAVSLQTIMTKSYCGDLEYLNNEIERVDNDYGYWAGGRYHYYIKDYQGNVRAVIDEAGRLEEVNNYYPYGGLMGAAGSGVQSRKYGGKELDRENGLDWYDSQARHYDPTAGRTPTMDSKAESFYSMTPYLWCAGNPVRNIDPTGEELIVMGSDEARQIYLDMIYNSTGSIYAFDDKNHMFLKNTDLNFRGKSSQTLRTLINSAIDSETEYSFSLTGDLMDDETVFIDSYITKQLDISDLMIIGKTSTALQGALIGHQINEIMVGGDYQTAHDISLKKEGVIYGELVGDHSISSRTDVPTVPDRPLDNIFQYNEEHSYLLQSGGTFTTERIGSKGTTITVIRNGELKKVKKL